MNHSLTTEHVLAIYGRELARYKNVKDAFAATRTEVRAELQAQCPPPSAADVAGKPKPAVQVGSMQQHVHLKVDPESPHYNYEHDFADVGDEHHHAHQVAHNLDLLKEAERLMADAGITEKGVG